MMAGECNKCGRYIRLANFNDLDTCEGCEATDAEIARLQAEVDAVKEARDMMGRLWQSARNDALEEAAMAMSPFLRSMISRGEAARIIRALKSEATA